MIKNKFILLMLLLFYLFTIINSLYSANNKITNNKLTKSKIISLKKFIRLACNNDSKFEEILIDSYYLKYKKDIDLPVKDLVMSLTSQYNFALNKDNNNNSESEVTLSKLFPETGTEVSASYNIVPNSLDDSKVSTFTTLISQPIAQNAFGKANRLKEKVSEVEIDITKYQIIEAYEDYLASLINIYYNWYYNYSNMKTAENTYNEYNKLLKNIKKRKKYSIAYQLDVDKIKLQVIEKQENYITLKNSFDNNTLIIRQAIKHFNNEIIIPEFSNYLNKSINYKYEYEYFKKFSRTYTILKYFEKKDFLNNKINTNNLLPSINLLFGYNKTGTGYQVNDSNDYYFTGFSFDYSFGQQKNKAYNEISKIDLKKRKLVNLNIKNQLQVDIKNLYDQVLVEKKLIDSAKQKIYLGKRILKEESKNYKQARLSLNDLIQVINNLENYKFNKISHEVKLNTLNIEWLRLNDKLVIKNVLTKKK